MGVEDSKDRIIASLKEEIDSLRRDNTELRISLGELHQALSDLNEAEQTLRLSEEKFQLLFENAHDEVIHLDRDGTVIDVNDSVEKLFGLRRDEVVGKNIAAFPVFNPGTKEEMLELFKATLQKDSGRFVEVEVRHKDGHPIWVEPSGSLIKKDGRVEGILVFLKDITERKRWQEKLEELYRQEKQLRKQIEEEMQRRAEFSRMLAHELKTPLTSVVTSSDSLLAEIWDERLLSLARNISKGAANLENRVDELLDLARGEVGILELNTEPVDFRELLRETVESLYPTAAGRSQSLSFDLPPAIPSVRADPARIRQVILNLLDNALKFTPKDGEIRVKAKIKGNNLIVEVQDTGPGMSKQEQDRVFEPYHRLAGDKGRLHGLGLGLALCKRLVELHNGAIWVKSRPGRGATFGFSLPLEVEVPVVPDLERIDKLWRVLIVDDDREIVDSVSLAFDRDWPEAELVSGRMGEEGIERVEVGDIDIVLLDLGLPDMDGFEVLQRIRLFSSVPVIIITVRDDEADVTRGLNLGADDYITKPFKRGELLARLQVQLRKQSVQDEESPIICGSLRLEPATFQLTHGSKEISLTTIEGNILKYLMRNWGRVVTHSRLAEEVWGEDYPGAVVSLRTHIRSLRGKLEADPRRPKLILTKAGVGYSLAKGN
ncbi:MAG: ATP-binding protein [Dehalococcoidia bacterium]